MRGEENIIKNMAIYLGMKVCAFLIRLERLQNILLMQKYYIIKCHIFARFLKPKTRKHMIELANKSVKDINIPFHVFPDKSSLYSLDKKTRKQMKKLREKYKNI